MGSLYAVLKEECKADVDLGPAHFWRPRGGVDAILIQWPEALFGWRPIDADDVDELWAVLRQWKALGTKLVLFRHNLRPHFLNSRNYEAAYLGLLERVDSVVHLGQYSRDECPKFEGVQHSIIAHPRYDQALPDLKKARERLGLQVESPTLLIYGATRHVNELRMIRNAARLFVSKYGGQVLYGTFPIHLLPFKRGGRFFMPFLERWWKWRYNAKVHNGKLHGLVESDYLAAADFIMVPRLEDHLNSGVLVKALSLGITPITTSVGNMAEIGRSLGMPMLEDESKLGLDYLFQELLTQEVTHRAEWKAHSANAWGRDTIAGLINDLLKNVLTNWPANQDLRKAEGWDGAPNKVVQRKTVKPVVRAIRRNRTP